MKSPANVPEFHGSHLKSWRGWEHTSALQAHINRWLHSGGYSLERTITDNGEHEYHIRFANLPGEWALLIGEAVQNLRNSLDNLVYALAELNAPQPLTEDEAAGLSFPITGPKPLSPKSLERATVYLPDNVREFIAEQQPSVAKAGYAKTRLWALHRLSNIDKHRAVPVSLVALDGLFASQPVTGSFQCVLPTTSLKDGDWLCSFTPGPSADDSISVVCDFSVVWGDQIPGLAGLDVVKSLQELREYVQMVHNQMLGLAGYNTSMPFGE